MNAVGVDVSKGWSMIAVMQPGGVIAVKPYKVLHTVSELGNLAEFLKSLSGETRVIMENTGNYHYPIAQYLHEQGLYVSVVQAKLIHDYDNNSLRKVKTDKADAKKIGKYGLANWSELRRYESEDETRKILKCYSRQYELYSKTKTKLKNNLAALLEMTFPGIKGIFTSPVRDDGHEKWIDFAETFWHSKCVGILSRSKFYDRYRKWCCKNKYRYSQSKADEIYEISQTYISTIPKNELTQNLIKMAVAQINAVAESQATLLHSMKEIAQSMPEWKAVIEMCGVGETLAAQLIAEIGDITRFDRKQSLTAFAGVDSPPNQSGQKDAQGKSVTKSGSAHLRRILFLVTRCLLVHKPNDTVYHFIDKKRSEGKLYLVYMVAGMNKFLRVYYGRLNEHLRLIT